MQPQALETTVGRVLHGVHLIDSANGVERRGSAARQGVSRSDALRLREQAVALLEGLIEERRRVEADLRERGRTDPIKSVTGSSALDAAIRSTRRMLAGIDRCLERAEVSTSRTAVNRFSAGVGDGVAALPVGVG